MPHWEHQATLTLEDGEQIFWKRDGYDYVGTVIEARPNETYYVEYQLDPTVKSWTDVAQDEVNVESCLRHHRIIPWNTE
jgi:hypothetical protein